MFIFFVFVDDAIADCSVGRMNVLRGENLRIKGGREASSDEVTVEDVNLI